MNVKTNRTKTVQLIRELNIPRKMLAGAADLDPKRVSDYTRGNGLTAAQEYLIQETVRRIATVWTAFTPFRVEIDSPQLLVDGLRIASRIETEREMREAEQEASKMLSAL